MMKITVMTATRNREIYLKNIYESLIEQNYTNIEWVIGDDASEDNTLEYINKIIKENKIKIKYIKSKNHIGKAVIENKIMDIATGDYIVSCDAGDYFTKNAFNNINKIINDNKVNEDKLLISLMGLCSDENNILQTKIKKNINNIIDWQEYFKNIKGDGCLITKRELVNIRFPEVDLVVNESSVWRKIQKGKKILIVNEIWKIMIREIEDNISYTPKIRYTKGWAIAITEAESLEYFKLRNKLDRIKLVVNYYRYTLHSEIRYEEANKIWNVLNIMKFYRLLYLFSLIFVLRDKMFKKIVKTYKIFDQNKINNEYIYLNND